jgi:hypothetical protein
MYVEHYKRWLKFFKKEQFLFVDGENFIKKPYDELKRVENFLNVIPFIQTNHFVFDIKKKFFCMNKNQELNKTECMAKDKGREHPDLSVDTLNKLKDFYRPYDLELFKMIDQKPFWKI